MIVKFYNRSIFLFLIIALTVTGCVNYEAANRHLNYGMAYIETGQYTPALKELMEADRNNPRDHRIKYYLGVCYHGKGLTKEAVAEFKKAVSLKPDYSEAHNYLGLLYTESGQLDEAIAEFRAALSNLLYETPTYAMSNLGWAYYKKGDYNAALAQYQEILNRDPYASILPIVERNIGIVLLARGQYGEALPHLRKCLEIAPEFAADQTRYWIGKALLGQGNTREAESEFLASIKFAPNSKFAQDSAAELENLKKRPASESAGPPSSAKTGARSDAAVSTVPVEGGSKIAGTGMADGPSWHVVKRGETLNSIARAYKVSLQSLCSANKKSLNYRVKVGQRLLIPSPRVKTGAPAQERWITYRVKPGDSLTSVAKKFHTTMADIKSLNNLRTDTLQKGQVLKIRTAK